MLDPARPGLNRKLRQSMTEDIPMPKAMKKKMKKRKMKQVSKTMKMSHPERKKAKGY